MYNLIEDKKRVLLCHSDSRQIKTLCFMSPITIEENSRLDVLKPEGRITIFGKSIRARDIIAYGDIDIHKEEDINFIRRLNLINKDGIMYPTGFNYETGNVIGKIRYEGEEERYLIIDTIDPILNFKLCHCTIGKPEYIIIYKETYLVYGKKLTRIYR